jgi:hypothetical protein
MMFSISFFHNTLRVRYRVKTMLHCLRQNLVFVREDLGKEPRTPCGAVFNALL